MDCVDASNDSRRCNRCFTEEFAPVKSAVPQLSICSHRSAGVVPLFCLRLGYVTSHVQVNNGNRYRAPSTAIIRSMVNWPLYRERSLPGVGRRRNGEGD